MVGEEKDPYDTTILSVFIKKYLLGFYIIVGLVLLVMVGLLAVAGYGFNFVKRSFFP